MLVCPSTGLAEEESQPWSFEARAVLKNRQDTSLTEEVEVGLSGNKAIQTSDKPKGEYSFNGLYKSSDVKLSDGSEDENYERKTEGKISWFLNNKWALSGSVSLHSKTEDNLIRRLEGLAGVFYDFLNLYDDSQDAKVGYELGSNEEIQEILEGEERARRANTIGSWSIQFKHTSEDQKFTTQLLIQRYETLNQSKESIDDAPNIPQRTIVEGSFRAMVNHNFSVGFTYTEECKEKIEEDNPLCHQESGFELVAQF